MNSAEDAEVIHKVAPAICVCWFNFTLFHPFTTVIIPINPRYYRVVPKS